VFGAITEGQLLADLDRKATPAATETAAQGSKGHVGRTRRDRDHRTVREGLPQSRAAAGRRPDAGDLPGFHGGAGVDLDRVANRHAGHAPDVEGGIALFRGDRQSGVGQAQHVEAFGPELRPGWDLHRGEDGRRDRVFGQGPVGDVDLAGAGVVELDERIRKFVELDGRDIPHLLGHPLGSRPAVRHPRGVGDQVTVEGRRSRGDLEGRTHGSAGSNRLGERLGRVGAAGDHGGPPRGHGDTQLEARHG